MKVPRICMIVPFKGKVDLVVKLIKSFQLQYASGFSYFMYCWDDGSKEEELQILWNSIPRELTIVKHEHKSYTAQICDAVNFVKQISDVDFLLLVNSDVTFKIGTMHSLIKRAISNPNVAAVGCKVLYAGKDEIQHTGTRLVNGKVEDPYVGLNKDDPVTNFVERRLWTNGCCTMYNLDILRKENLNFSMEFSPAYFEEADLMTKLNILGYSVLYEPKAAVEHIVNATMGLEREKYEKIFWANWDKYLNKWKNQFTSKQLQF